jgi:hypothetical protein
MDANIGFRQQKPQIKQRIAAAFTPRAVTIWRNYRREIGVINEIALDAIPSVGDYKATLRDNRTKRNKALLAAGLKVIGAAAFYNVTAGIYGVSARDNSLSFDATQAWRNTSSVSLTIATGAASLIPAEYKDAVAHMIIGAEWTLSAVRMWVEQKAWNMCGFTPDPAGTLLTPYLAGLMEFGYKLTVTYPQDTDSRLAVGLVGIYGNFVRMAHAGLIMLAVRISHNIKLNIKLNTAPQ